MFHKHRLSEAFNRFILDPPSGIPINIILFLLYYFPYFPFTSLFPRISGKGNHNNISPETQSILFLDIFKVEQRILEPAQETGGDTRGSVCVVVQLRAQTEQYSVAFTVSLWKMAAWSHEPLLHIHQTHIFFEAPSLCPQVNYLSRSFFPLATPGIILISLHTTRGPCAHDKQMHILYSQSHYHISNSSVDVQEYFLFMWCSSSGSSCNRSTTSVITYQYRSNDGGGASAQHHTDKQPWSHKDK